MTEYRPRFFTSDAEITHLGERFLARALPKEEWTHEAHLATTTWLLLKRPDIDVDKELPGLIRRYNESVGGVNSDSEGYHETITRAFLAGVRLFLGEADRAEPLHELVNELLLYRRAALDQADSLPTSVREHRAIVERLAARQPAAAGRLLSDHVLASRERMHRKVGVVTPPPPRRATRRAR